MTVKINGTTRELSRGMSIADLLNELDLTVEGTAVALNGAVIPRQEHGRTTLREDDKVEVIRAVAGG